MKEFIRIHEKDNVIVALKDLKEGTQLKDEDLDITLKMDVAKGHKVAIEIIPEGENIIKYGYAIGRATQRVLPGAHVHTSNLKTNLSGTLEYSYEPALKELAKASEELTFKGYKRSNGDVGIRNELWIIPTVGCVNATADLMVNRLKESVENLEIDDISVWKHPFGCSQLGQDHEDTANILRDLVMHPNAGGVLVLGLGCENNTIDRFKEGLGDYDGERVKFLISQEVDDEIEDGSKLLKELYDAMKEDERVEVPLSVLKVGLKCGGSDGLSGITANPLVGAFSDFLIAQGGTTVLTEVPEMFGAETVLMNRAASGEIFNATVSLINDFKSYYLKYDQPVYENPSPGNKKGGISSLEDKSLGCVQKGGSATVVDVLKYSGRIVKKGLNLLSAPGNDLVATTALGATGCQMVLFTTGRGTPFGGFIPTIKISTNTEIYNKKPHWIDFNAGELIHDQTMEEAVKELVQYIIDVASGRLVNHEKNNFKEISIFRTGVTL
ncbi:UxaA family hydrolase [Vallitalea okinawensis]|uniref:UxaA family hydrolase n=1 Tax=Vallitalea okinawensis TaxID=2078660 RepID=UPI000CFC9F24|nr:altronate dehydratase family protein [Vallitalea okinawensis]